MSVQNYQSRFFKGNYSEKRVDSLTVEEALQVDVNGDTVDSANISSLERSWVDVNDRKLSVLSIWEEVHEIVSPNDFLNILYKAIEVYTEWNETVPGTRRANAYAAKHGILRNQSINVKHIAAILLYAKHTELSDNVFAVC